jgi:hypothetical protein
MGFFIASSLFAGCGPCRNQPNDFFTLVGKPGVDDEKDRPGPNLAKGDVSVFFVVMGKVPNGNGVGVVEHQFSRLKIDVMLGEILLVLPLVALETHVACRY